MGITKRMVLLVWGGIILLAAGSFFNLNISIFIAINTLLFMLFILDYKLTPGRECFEVERILDPPLEIGKEKKITFRVLNRSSRSINMELKDTIPLEIVHDNLSRSIECPTQKEAFANIKVCPSKRGSFVFGNIYVRYRGVLGLCTKQFQVQCSKEVPVYPDLYPMKKYHLLSRSRLLLQDDASAHKTYGIGTDFQYLRDYTTDDEYRKINWNATARSQKVITGIYDVEKNQNVIICIDTGRNMMSAAGGLTRLDYSIESALVLVQVAIDKGDRVGLVVFGNDVKLFLKPAKDPSQINKIIHALYSIQPDFYESDYNELTSYLEKYNRKRSLICIFSHPGTEETCRELAASLSPVSRKSALLLISILNPGLKEILNSDVESIGDAYSKAASVYRLQTEHNAQTIMSRLGITTIMAEPKGLTPQVINRYIDMKKAMKV